MAVPASPYATGGGGTVLEHRYGAVLLAALLTRDPMTELGDDVIPIAVTFQASRFSPVDDLMVQGLAPDGLEHRVSIGVRRNPSLAPSDEGSVALIRSYLQTVDARWPELVTGRWRLALAVASPNRSVQQLAILASLAQAEPNDASFRAAIAQPGRTSAPIRARLRTTDSLVKAALQGDPQLYAKSPQDMTWRFLSTLRLRELRLEGIDQTDRTNAVARLRFAALYNSTASAAALFSRLSELSDRYAPVGATVNEDMLRRDLSGLIVPLEAPDHIYTTTSPKLDAILHKWAIAVHRTLISPPSHMRSLGVRLSELRQEVYLTDPREQTRARGTGISWDAVTDSDSPDFRSRALIVAGPGYGKSTMLAIAAADVLGRLIASLEANAQLEGIPIHVTCAAVASRLTNSSASEFASAVADVAALHLPEPERPTISACLRRYLSSSGTTLFLDGLDEVAEPDPDRLHRRPLFVSALASFLDESDARVYLTTRPYDVPDLTSVPFEWLALKAFGPQQVFNYASKVLGPTGGAALVQSLRGRAADMAGIPVMLSFLCLIAKQGSATIRAEPLPARLFDLYATVLDRVASTAWRDTQNAAPRKEQLLSRLPAVVWQLASPSWRTQFTAAELFAAAGTVGHDLREVGLVVPVGNSLQFLHASLAEHLAAAYVARLPISAGNTEVAARLVDPAWANVWPHLASALADDPPRATQLLSRVLEHSTVAVAGSCLVESTNAAPADVTERIVTGLLSGVARDETRQECDVPLSSLLDMAFDAFTRSKRSPALKRVAELVTDAVANERVPYPYRLAALKIAARSNSVEIQRALASAANSRVRVVRESAQQIAEGVSYRKGVRQPLVSEGKPSERLIPPILAALIGRVTSQTPLMSPERLLLAFELANEAHIGRVTRIGRRHVDDCIDIAGTVADLGLDDIPVAAALLHDVQENTGVDRADIVSLLGRDVADIVEAVAHVRRVRPNMRDAKTETVGRLLASMAKDPRVLAILLAQRLLALRTIATESEGIRIRTAQETLDIHGTLAERIGAPVLRSQLEDLAFATLYPRRYAEIEQMMSMRNPDGDVYLSQVIDIVRSRLMDVRVDVEVSGFLKHNWNIYATMVADRVEFDKVYDVMSVRVVTHTVKDCYASLGTVHATWRPIGGQFRDYIAMPTVNLYQSLHTTVVGPLGRPVEVQIRTREMDLRIRRIDAARWGEDGRVYVLTPAGDVLTLAEGSTPIDFAYAIHSDVGHKCIGALVDGVEVRLDSQLVTGSTVEILTSFVPSVGPKETWLTAVGTRRARRAIRRWLAHPSSTPRE